MGVTVTALASRTGRRAVIAIVAAVSVACLIVALTYGRSPVIPPFIFACFSAPYLVAGAIGWMRRPGNPTGPLLLLIGLAGALILLGAAPLAWIGIVTQLSATTATVLLFLILLISPAGRFSTRLDAIGFGVLAVTYAAVVLVRDPALDAPRPVVLALVCIALLLLVLRRWHRASGPTRRSLGPIAVAGTITTAIFLANSITTTLGIPNEPGSVVFAVDAIGRALIPFGFLAGLLRLRLARIAVADLVTALADLPAPERLRDDLATALGDPTLQVGYWSPAEGTYLAANGSPFQLPTDGDRRAVTTLERHGSPVAAIVHDPALDEDPGLVAAVGAAVRLAVEDQLEEVRASRARIVAAGDAERRRVERDLHDGAQQRLVSMTLAIRIARTRLADDTDPQVRKSLDQASDDARAALAELRELARGIHPQILTEAGLAAAIESLADRSPVDVTVEIAADERFSPTVEGAAYFVVSEALANIAKHAHATHVLVRAERQDDHLALEVADDGIGGADPASGSGLRGLADRLSALDGTVEVVSPAGGGTRLLVRIPTTALATIAG